MVDYVLYPSTLPLPQSNFTGTMGVPTQNTEFSSGKVRRRRIGRSVVKKATMEWLFTPDEYDVFSAWWEQDISMGCSPFRMNMITGGNGQNGEHVVQFTDDMSFNHEECNWRVSIPCILFPFPKLDENGLVDGLMGSPIKSFVNVMNKYYVRNYTL